MLEIAEKILVLSAIFAPAATATVFFLRATGWVSLANAGTLIKRHWLLPSVGGALIGEALVVILLGPPLRLIDSRILLFPLAKDLVAIAIAGLIALAMASAIYEGISHLRPLASRLALAIAPMFVALPILGIQFLVFSEELVGTTVLPDDVPITDRAVVERVASGIRLPTSLAADSTGRIIATDFRSGDIWLIEPSPEGNWSKILFAKVPLPEGIVQHEGLWHAALNPEETYVYAFATATVNPDTSSRTGATSRVVRFPYDDGEAGPMEVVLSSLPSAVSHAGGALTFGPDGNLYLTIGDVYLHMQARSPRGITGSILRYTPEGDIPVDNPFLGSPVYAYGFKNPYGLAVHPENGMIYTTENGSACCDRLIRVERGRFHGWPVYGARPSDSKRMESDPKVVAPLYDTGIARIAPAQVIIYGGNQYGDEFKGSLFFVAFNSGAIYRAVVSDAGSELISMEVIWQSDPPRGLTGITVGAHGYIYFGGIDGIFRILSFD